MSHQFARDLAHLACPLCPEKVGLELALRLELEAETELVFAVCPACHRLYEVTPSGSSALEFRQHAGLSLLAVRCPRCRTAGYALSYTPRQMAAENHVFITCRECHHTFGPSEGEAAPAAEKLRKGAGTTPGGVSA